LLYFDGRLVAVLVKLSDQHDHDIAGKWFMEHAFGSLGWEHPVLDTLEDAESWIRANIR